MCEKFLEKIYFNEPVSEVGVSLCSQYFITLANTVKIIMGRFTVYYCLLVQLTNMQGYFEEHIRGQWTKS